MTTSLITQRVLFNLTDISVAVSDYRVGTYSISYTAGNYLYIGSSCPFNNTWIEMSVVSATSAGAPVVQVWWNGTWSNVVDIIDQTNGMTVNGRISWALDIEKGWNCEQKSVDVGLTGTSIYNRFWARISWPNTFTAGVGYIGQKFSGDGALAASYPDLMQSAILSGYKAGKTNWDEQHFMAAEAIVKEVRKRNFALHRGQLMDWTVFEDAACHKVAEIVYQAFGAPYQDHVAKANKRYNDEMNTRFMVVDVNENGHVEQDEITRKSGYLTR
jgi:hypothetical protein